MAHAHHHQHVRKRLSKKLAPFPHPIRWKRQLDRAILILGVGNVFATFPQLYEIYSNQDAGNISIITWGYYTVFSTITFLYGVVHKEKPIIITYLMGAVLYAAITIGAIIY